MRPGELTDILGTCQELGHTVSLAESLTGGLVSALIAGVPGASKVFSGSVVAYRLASKQILLNIPADVLGEDAVNSKTAYLMARSACGLFSSTWGLGLTGFAGPEGGTALNPVGTVYIAVCGPIRTLRRFHFVGSRQRVRAQASHRALELWRSCLDRCKKLGLG